MTKATEPRDSRTALASDQLAVRNELIALAKAFSLSPQPEPPGLLVEAARPLTAALLPPPELDVSAAALRLAGRRIARPATPRPGGRRHAVVPPSVAALNLFGEVADVVGGRIEQVLPGLPPLGGLPGFEVLDQLIDDGLLNAERIDDLLDELRVVQEALGRVESLGQLEVKVQATWQVLEQNRDLFLGGDFLAAPGPADTLRMDLLFSPPIVEDRDDLAATPRELEVRATVELSATVAGETVSSGPRTVASDIPVLQGPLPVPKLFCMFRHQEYLPEEERDGERHEGFLLAVASEEGPFPRQSAVEDSVIDDVFAVLATLRNAVRPLAALGVFGPLLRGLGFLLGGDSPLRAQPATGVEHSPLRNLNRIRMIRKGSVFENREAEDEVSACIFLGPPDAKVQCCADRRFSTAGGALEITLGREMMALIPRLPARPEVDLVPLGLEGPFVGSSTVDVVQPSRYHAGRFSNTFSSVKF